MSFLPQVVQGLPTRLPAHNPVRRGKPLDQQLLEACHIHFQRNIDRQSTGGVRCLGAGSLLRQHCHRLRAGKLPLGLHLHVHGACLHQGWLHDSRKGKGIVGIGPVPLMSTIYRST